MVYPPTQRTSGRKPEEECVGRTLRSVSAGGFVKCFGGFRRRNIRNNDCEAVGLHFLQLITYHLLLTTYLTPLIASFSIR